MHILILAEFAVASGGAEKVAVESARALAEAGETVTFIQAVAGPRDALLDHPRIACVDLGLTDIWSLPAWRAAATGVWHAEAARRLASCLDALASNPDCIHLHQWTRTLSPSVMPVLFARGVPIFATLHEYFLSCPNGVYYRFDRGTPCDLTPMSGACLAAACDPKSRLHKLVRVARAAAMRRVLVPESLDVIHVSDASVARMGAQLSGFAFHHHRVDNPVRVERGAPADPAGGDALVYVGRLTREKGVDLVAEAAARVGLPALIIGAGSLDDELRARPGVEVLPWQHPDVLAAIVRKRARAICAPSRWYETGPLTIYEALAQGIPVIASNRSGASEKVIDGVTGLVVEPEPDAMAQAAARLTDDAFVSALGRAAHERYWARPLSLRHHALTLQGVYRQALARRSARETPRTGLRATSRPVEAA